MNKRPTQCDKVLAYLDEHGSITALDALMDLGIMRLGARIWELIHTRGINITKEFITVKNRFGQDCSIALYKKAA